MPQVKPCQKRLLHLDAGQECGAVSSVIAQRHAVSQGHPALGGRKRLPGASDLRH